MSKTTLICIIGGIVGVVLILGSNIQKILDDDSLFCKVLEFVCNTIIIFCIIDYLKNILLV